jgi:hypothetical protein
LGQSDDFQEPVVRISANGKTRTLFDARKVAGVPKDFFGSDFSVDSSGDVYQIILTRSFDLLAVHFAADGTGGSILPLRDLLNPISISVEPTGDLVVAGTPPEIGNTRNASHLVIAVFDRNGEAKGTKRTITVQPPFQLRFGGGKLYVLSGNDVRVFGEAGEMIGQFHLEPDASLQLSGWFPWDGSLTAEFDNSASEDGHFKGVIAVFDATTGNLRRKYKLSEAVRGGLACASEKKFTFLTRSPDGHLSLLTADSPQ